MCMVWPCHSFVDGISKKCINVYKKFKLIKHDCLPILMLLCVMLYIMLAYLMLFAALSNAVCLYAFSIFFAIDFCKCFLFHALSWFITQLVYFKYDFPSSAVLLICWFFLIPCLHNFYI